jgi:hypothetical protein
MRRDLLGVVLVVLGCTNGTAPGEPVLLHVSQIDAPASVAAGSSFAVNLTVGVGGCLVFDHIEARKSASDIILTVWGTDNSNQLRPDMADRGVDVVCAAARTEVRSITLKAPSAGTLTLVVEEGTLAPLTATVKVQ